MSNAPSRAATQGKKKKKKKQQKTEWYFWVIGLVIVFLILGLIAGGGLVLFYQQFQFILPGVSVGPLPVGNRSIQDAAVLIDTYWNQQPRFLVEDGENQWAVTLPNIGIWVDPGLTANSAYEIGRNENGWDQIQQLIFQQGISIQPQMTFDEQLARDVFTELGSRINIPSQDAQLTRTANGEWVALPGKSGLALDVEAAVGIIKSDPQAMVELGYLTLSMVPVEPNINNVSGQLDRIAAYYEKPLYLQAYDPIDDETINWMAPQEMVASWIEVEDPYGEPALNVNEQQFLDYLETWEASIGAREIESMDVLDSIDDAWSSGEPFKMILRQLPTAYTVRQGQNLISVAFDVGMPYWKIQEANPGISLYGIYPGQVLTIPSKNEMLPLPVVPNKRIVISISQQYMWLYENGEVLSEHVISTGMANSPTLPGVFQVQTHEVNAYASNWDLWMPHFLGIYEAVPGFMNGIHGLPLLSSGVRLWGSVLGQPASYGCIITDLPTGENLFNWAEDGVVVEILA